MVPEDTAILVVSDHGAKSMQGGVCINEWLWREGYLSFVHDPNPSELKIGRAPQRGARGDIMGESS